MTIRLAKEADYANLMELYNGFVGEDRYSSHTNDAFQKVLKNSLQFIFVAEDESQLVGFASFSIRDVIRYPKPIAELDELYVSPDFRNHGLGKLLMESVEGQAKEAGCYRLYIESGYDHKAAHAFYESRGYKNYGYHFMKHLS